MPFASHLDFTGILPQLTSLDVQLAPHPTSDILSDRTRLGRADPAKCLQEFYAGYRWLTSIFATYAVIAQPAAAGVSSAPLVPLPHLKTFICRDKANARTESFREELDELFVPLCECTPDSSPFSQCDEGLASHRVKRSAAAMACPLTKPHRSSRLGGNGRRRLCAPDRLRTNTTPKSVRADVRSRPISRASLTTPTRGPGIRFERRSGCLTAIVDVSAVSV
jgi:hypothetical protein